MNQVLSVVWIVVPAFAASAALAQSPSAEELCAATYGNQVMRVSTNQQLTVGIRTISKNACSSSNRNFTAGFDSNTKALIESVPVVSSFVGRLGISNNKQFCDAYQSGQFNLAASDSYLLEPVVNAQEQFNSCMAIAQRNKVIITHKIINPAQIIFDATFTSTEIPINFTALTSGGFTCVAPRVPGGPAEAVGTNSIRRDRNFSVLCTRPGVRGSNEDVDYGIGSVALATSAGTYTAWVPADALNGIYTRRTSLQRISEQQSTIDKLNRELEFAQRQYDGLNATVVRFYFGEKRQNNAGTQLNCSAWRYWSGERNPEVRLKTLQTRFCPKGRLFDVSRYLQVAGHKCGYNYYTAVCQTPGS